MGTTMIELLVVIAIISVLSGLLLNSVVRAKMKVQRIECLNYQRQLKIFYYTSDFEDGSPPYTIQPLMQVSRIGYKCYKCHANAP